MQQQMEPNMTQIEDLTKAVARCSDLIEMMDTVIDLAQQRRNVCIEQRAQLNIIKDMLMQRPATGGSTKQLEAGAAGIFIVDRALQAIEDHIDRETAATERQLKEQREWKEQNPGRQYSKGH